MDVLLETLVMHVRALTVLLSVLHAARCTTQPRRTWAWLLALLAFGTFVRTTVSVVVLPALHESEVLAGTAMVDRIYLPLFNGVVFSGVLLLMLREQRKLARAGAS